MCPVCHPKANGELHECALLGQNLSRLSQPTILAILAASDEPMHGSLIVQEAANYPTFGGEKPDPAGFYRTLKKMQQTGLVSSEWDTPDSGVAKRIFTLTDEGRACLRRWIDSLACYRTSIDEFRVAASAALGISVPDDPICGAWTPPELEDAQASADGKGAMGHE